MDTLCPLHLRLDGSGTIVHAGPTLRRISGDRPLLGAGFFSVFEFSSPRGIETVADLRTAGSPRLHLRFAQAPCTGFKAVAVPDDGAGAIVNLSFGIHVAEAVETYGLTAADFAHTDLAVEMLYLVEAKSAALDLSRSLNARLEGARIAAEEQAYTDTLTGLKNRRALEHVFARLVDRHRSFALMHLDLDYFKQVNDTLGHAAGDAVLQRIARLLVEETRAEDTVARIGGDEFVVLIQRPGSLAALEAAAVRIIERIEEPLRISGKGARVSASAGTTLSDYYPHPELGQMLADADSALYSSKRQGRGRHRVFSPGNAAAAR